MEEMSAEEMLQKSINDLTKGLNGAQREQVLRQAAKILDAARLLAASGAGPVPIPVSSAGAASGTPLICPVCSSQIKITLSP
jgi:hypothetical protein